uniref:Uncharacterized protein n=1 Tax=Oryza meridionalis TaxID=40149 RepID=A0A0E0D2D0_9ORYZ
MISVCHTRTRGHTLGRAPLLILHLSLPFRLHLTCARLAPIASASAPSTGGAPPAAAPSSSVACGPWPLSSPALGGSASGAGELTGDPPGPGGKGGGSLCPLEGWWRGGQRC